MNFYVLTLFPEMIYSGLNYSIIKRALDKNIINIETINIRDFSNNKHRQVDDYPYGGGAGMVMKPEPIYLAYESVKAKTGSNTRVVFMTPCGKTYNQKIAEEFSKEDNLILLCGHYEGIDERVLDLIVTDEISLGDFVITGGELAAMTVIDSVSRLIPGVLSKEESYINESFSNGLLEYPQYTRPYNFNGIKVPDILISGHHKNIDKWRREKSIEKTYKKRPDLINDLIDEFDKDDMDFLKKLYIKSSEYTNFKF